MYRSKDFERLFIRYKDEACPNDESIQTFCLRKSPIQHKKLTDFSLFISD